MLKARSWVKSLVTKHSNESVIPEGPAKTNVKSPDGRSAIVMDLSMPVASLCPCSMTLSWGHYVLGWFPLRPRLRPCGCSNLSKIGAIIMKL
jgi:hypothetical protein